MLKKTIFFVSLIILLGFQKMYAIENIPQKPEIIPRESWGANELYTDIESSYWQAILERRKNSVSNETEKQKQKREEDYAKSLAFINENFSSQNTATKILRYDVKNDLKLAWPLKYTDYVNAIVVHHTHSEYKSSVDWMNDIYRYHSLNRQWWDIGYNYIIGYDGEIYEGKKWGDYVAAAHSHWNNYSTLWIAVMWNYESEGINEKQYASLESLVRYFTWKYGIDLSKKYYYHMDCAGEKCNTFPLETYLESTLVWHRDTGHTSCPGEKLYEQIQQIREDNLDFTQGFTPIKREDTLVKEAEQDLYTPIIQKYIKILQWYSLEDRKTMLQKVEQLIKNYSDDEMKRKIFQIFRLALILSNKESS